MLCCGRSDGLEVSSCPGGLKMMTNISHSDQASIHLHVGSQTHPAVRRVTCKEYSTSQQDKHT